MWRQRLNNIPILLILWPYQLCTIESVFKWPVVTCTITRNICKNDNVTKEIDNLVAQESFLDIHKKIEIFSKTSGAQ